MVKAMSNNGGVKIATNMEKSDLLLALVAILQKYGIEGEAVFSLNSLYELPPCMSVMCEYDIDAGLVYFKSKEEHDNEQ